MVLTAQCHVETATKEILAITSMGHVQEDVIQAGKKIPVYKVSPQIISSYCMVCASVLEYNPQTLVSGLSPVQAHTPFNNFICVLWDILC